MGNKSSFTLKGLRREIGKRVPTEAHGHHGAGFKTVPDGHETADVEIMIDVETIARQMGSKAMKSKVGRSKAMHGAIVVYLTNRKRVKPPEGN